MREANITLGDPEFDAMGIEELLSLGWEAGIREFEELACHGTGAIVRVDVESRYDEQRLAELSCVTEWEHVSETADGHRYVIEFTAPELPESLAERAADLVGTCDPTLTENGASVSFVGSQESISETLDEYEAAGVSPELRKLGSYAGRNGLTDALTDRQHEVIQTAFEMGYYEVPREASTAEVAEELDLDDSTVTEHLQRAERNVFTRIFDG